MFEERSYSGTGSEWVVVVSVVFLFLLLSNVCFDTVVVLIL